MCTVHRASIEVNAGMLLNTSEKTAGCNLVLGRMKREMDCVGSYNQRKITALIVTVRHGKLQEQNRCCTGSGTKEEIRDQSSMLHLEG